MITHLIIHQHYRALSEYWVTGYRTIGLTDSSYAQQTKNLKLGLLGFLKNQKPRLFKPFQRIFQRWSQTIGGSDIAQQ